MYWGLARGAVEGRYVFQGRGLLDPSWIGGRPCAVSHGMQAMHACMHCPSFEQLLEVLWEPSRMFIFKCVSSMYYSHTAAGVGEECSSGVVVPLEVL